jgi:hypothetical protein
MLAKHEKWLPMFLGNDVTTHEDHMSNFWAFFQLSPVSDDAEDLMMNFSLPLFKMLLEGGITVSLMPTSQPWIN